MRPCLLDLFCGAGGLSSGLEMAGFEVVAGIDINSYSAQTFKFNFPKAISLIRDLGNYHPQEFSKDYGFPREAFNVIIGGPPCQGFSVSGPRDFKDPRNQLYLEFIKYVEFFKPSAFIAENVPGLVGLYRGKVKERIIEAFGDLGYYVCYKILLASDYGVPQNRKRVFFVGIRDKRVFKFPDPTHFSLNNNSATFLGDHLRKVTVADAINDLPSLEQELGTEEADYLHPSSNNYQEYCREGSRKIYNHIATKHTEQTREIIAMVPEGGNYKMLPPELQDTRRFHIAWTRIDSQKPAPTVDTGHRHHFHPWVNRVPTVRENARFQSFQDRFVFRGPKTSQYEQVGNAVPPLVARALGKELTKYL